MIKKSERKIPCHFLLLLIITKIHPPTSTNIPIIVDNVIPINPDEFIVDVGVLVSVGVSVGFGVSVGEVVAVSSG